MATVLLTYVGGIWGPVGAFAGGLIGGIIDSYLFSELLGGGNGPVPLDALRRSSGDEGTLVPYGVGPECPCPGEILWVGPLQVFEVEVESGKGGDGPTTFEYKVDVAVSFHKGKKVSRIPKIWIGGEVLQDADIDSSLAGSDITLVPLTVQIHPHPPGIFAQYYDLSAPDGGTDLGDLHPGPITVAGWANGENNGSFQCSWSKRNLDGTSEARIFKGISVSAAIAEGPGVAVTLVQDLPESNSAMVQSVTFYDGDPAQVEDATIDAAFDDGTTGPFVPAFRGHAYVLLKGLSVTKYGATIPQFRALVEERAVCKVSDAITDFVERAGRSADDIDVTALTGIEFRGITQLGPTAPSDSLRQIMYAYYLDAQEDNQKIRFFERKNATVVPVEAAKFGAHQMGRPTEAPIQEIVQGDHKMPQELNVSFMNRDRDWQAGNMPYRATTNVTNVTVRETINLTLSTAEGLTLAMRRLMAARINRDRKEWQLPQNEIGVLPGDLVTVTIDGEPHKIYVERRNVGLNGLLQLQGLHERSSVWDLTPTLETLPPQHNIGQVPLPGALITIIQDVPPFRETWLTELGLLFAAAPADTSGSFPSAGVFRSTDGGTTYLQILTMAIESTIGRTDGTLAGGTKPDMWDLETTIDIIIEDDVNSLESKTEAEVLAGRNHLLIGDEIVGFVTATAIGTNTWTISKLLRGRYDTAAFIGTHVANEQCLDLNGATYYKNFGLSAFQSTDLFKIVMAGGSLADATAISVQVGGGTQLPFSTYGARFRRAAGTSAAFDMTYTFHRASRRARNTFGAAMSPLEETVEKYEIDVVDPSGPTVVRTLTVQASDFTDSVFGTGQPFFKYTSADNISDFTSFTKVVTFRIYQIGDTVGRGRLYEFTAAEAGLT